MLKKIFISFCLLLLLSGCDVTNDDSDYNYFTRLEIIESTKPMWFGSDDIFWIKGKVKNNGNLHASNSKIFLIFKEGTNVIKKHTQLLGIIKPDEIKEFSFEDNDIRKSSNSYEYFFELYWE